MKQYREICGIVRTQAGEPLAGALVMGVDLGWAETDHNGAFRVQSPELALVVWCSGYYPAACPLPRGSRIDITMRAVRHAKAAVA